MQICTLTQTDDHASTHHSVFRGWMPFLPPNQQRQSIEGNLLRWQTGDNSPKHSSNWRRASSSRDWTTVYLSSRRSAHWHTWTYGHTQTYVQTHIRTYIRTYIWLGGSAARAFDLWVNGREFETCRPLALPGSNFGQVTHTYWPSRSQWSIAGVPGCRWETAVSALITTTTVIRSLGHGLQHLSCSA